MPVASFSDTEEHVEVLGSTRECGPAEDPHRGTPAAPGCTTVAAE